MADIDIKNLKFLVVDDHHLMRQMVTKHLQSLKATTYEQAQNGYDAYDRLEKAREAGAPFNVICLDWNMPVMDGLELLKKCRGDKNYEKTAIIMLTAESEQKLVMKAIQEGATSYIIKPFSLDEFTKKMGAVLEWLKK